MTTTVYEIPTIGCPKTFSIQLSSTTYQLTITYRDAENLGWMLDISNADGDVIINGIPMVTGCNLLGQYDYLGFPGELWVHTDGSQLDLPPTYDNLGSDAHLYFVVRS